MVLALLDESDLDIASDAVEMIVDRVRKYLSMCSSVVQCPKPQEYKTNISILRGAESVDVGC